MDNNLDTNYNYIFYNIATDYLEPVFKPLDMHPTIKVFRQAFDCNSFIRKIFFYHWSAKLNSRINLPLKNLWFKRMFDIDFRNDKPTCYVFYMAKYIKEDYSIFEYIKKLNPDNKCIIYYGDLISKIDVDIEEQKKHCDYIITYDEGEAEKYNIVFDDNSMGYGVILDVTEPDEFEYDAFFVGFAKDRLDDIHSVFNYLSANGLKCKFVICGTKPEDRLHREGLVYSDPISYKENLENVKNSRCILDIIQGQSCGITLRVKEAKVYKRKLLTNNPNLKDYSMFDKKNMRVYSSVQDIDIDFIKSELDYFSFIEDENMQPERIIKYFEKVLEGAKK